MSDYSDCAAIWVAGRSDYTKMAQESAKSVARHLPDVARILVTEQTGNWGGFHLTLHRRLEYSQDWWYRDAVNWAVWALENVPAQYQRLVFLDTDTWTMAPWYPFLDLLPRFDVAGAHAVTRHTTNTWIPVPLAFPEIEVGVLGVARNERAVALFKLWKELYDSYTETYGNNDQGPLREALWRLPDVRLYVVPPEYHNRWGFGSFLAGKAYVLHSRTPFPEQQRHGEIINEDPCGMRLCRPYQVIYRPGKPYPL